MRLKLAKPQFHDASGAFTIWPAISTSTRRPLSVTAIWRLQAKRCFGLSKMPTPWWLRVNFGTVSSIQPSFVSTWAFGSAHVHVPPVPSGKAAGCQALSEPGFQSSNVGFVMVAFAEVAAGMAEGTDRLDISKSDAHNLCKVAHLRLASAHKLEV